MNKKRLNIVLALAVGVVGLMGLSETADAKTQETGWTINFDGSTVSSGTTTDKGTIVSAMPGDTIQYNVTYTNSSTISADFYLDTEVINSLENKNADGTDANISGEGAYSYSIKYTIDGATTTIYDSESVGAIETSEITENNKSSYFGIGNLAAGNSGLITVEVVLDGNSQDNDYMAKLATLELKLGVEKDVIPENKTNTVTTSGNVKKVVYTVPGGTEVVLIDDPIVPLDGPQTGDSIIPILISSVALLIGILLVIWYFRLTRKEKEEVA
ncbi:MAG: hypothetical protein K6E79_00435 [Pseudobutyrivibrio sp.]|nr:hypothetical protein [Pseudobutyrivibrio sp.]